jgi:putative peptidoglycan lipid II flippase
VREVADTAPSPTAVAAALESLIVAADIAHGAGLALNISDPGRVRISSDGHAALAFPATFPETGPRDDLRGIGGILYALLIGRWPAQEPMPSGWPAVEVDDAGRAVEPVAVKPDIPFLISSAAAGLLRSGDGIADAATLLTLLRKGRDVSLPRRQARRSHNSLAPHTPPQLPGAYARFRNVDPAEQAVQARRGLMKTVLVASAAMGLIAVLSLGDTLNRVLGENDDAVAMDSVQLGLVPSTAAPTPEPSQPDVAGRAAAGAAVIPIEAVVFSPDGSPDNPDTAASAIDRDPATMWSTDRYYDADPFPKFKEGLGLLLRLPRPTALSAVDITTAGGGTVIQVRDAGAGTPKSLAETTELGPPATLQPGTNRIELDSRRPVTTALVWISRLGSTDGSNRAAIAEVAFSPAARA